MKTIPRLFVVFLISLVSQVPAHAWSGPGHATVAAMAYRQLPAETQRHLAAILMRHPKFATWKKEFNAKKSTFPAKLDLGTFLFVRASTWPDEIRRSGNPFDHPDWHFVDYPVQQSDFSTGPTPASPAPENDILFGIEESLRTIRDPHASPEARAAHLSWVIHLVGDLHQPLHCASLVNSTTYPAPEGDRGGNKFFVSVPGKKLAEKLHSFWDGQLGTSTPPNPRTAFNAAVQLESEKPRGELPQLGTAADVKAWSLESLDVAVNHAYRYEKKVSGTTKITPLPGSADDRRAPPIPAGYSQQVEQIARERVALAGYRLADTLQALKP
jgi:hypothetical protein